MGKAGSVTQFILKQLFRSADVNSLTAELGADPIIGHDEDDGTRCDFDLGDATSGTVGHVVKHIYQRSGYKIKTVDANGVVIHNADMTAISSIDIPIGGIIWWYKSLGGVPSLPSGWVECNGQVLNDTESLLHEQTMPNINGLGYFIRGNATAGITQTSQNLQHNHTSSLDNGTVTGTQQYDVRAQTAGFPTISGITSDGTGWAGLAAGTSYKINTAYTQVLKSSTLAVATGVTVGNSGSSEARPINISMVAIIRVK